MKLLSSSLVLLAVLLVPRDGDASVITFSDRESFEAQGTIVATSNFDVLGPTPAWTGPGTWITDPYTEGGVTYTASTYVLNVSSGADGTGPKVFVDGFLRDLYLEMESPFTMIGFDIGAWAPTSPGQWGTQSILVTTTGGQYLYEGLHFPRVQGTGGLGFIGFVAGPGESFVALAIGSCVLTHGFCTDPYISPGAIANVSVGNLPEPSLLALLAVGAAAFGLRRRA